VCVCGVFVWIVCAWVCVRCVCGVFLGRFVFAGVAVRLEWLFVSVWCVCVCLVCVCWFVCGVMCVLCVLCVYVCVCVGCVFVLCVCVCVVYWSYFQFLFSPA